MKKYEEVMQRIINLIHQGSLRKEDRLPSIRSMARQMNISTMTVLEGYIQLERLGLIQSRPQSGFYVIAEEPYSSKTINNQAFEARALKFEQEYSQAGLSVKSGVVPEPVQQFAPHHMKNVDLPLGDLSPNPLFFPNKALSRRLARVANNYANVINNYAVDTDCEELVEMILKLMNRWDCVAHRNEILIINGGTQALMSALRILTRPGDLVAVESPGYPGFYYLLNFFGLRALEIPTDPRKGLDVDRLLSFLEKGIRPACLLFSSNFSVPTGALMPDKAKEFLAQICQRYKLPVIEDDTFGELYFGPSRPLPLKAFMPANVIYVGSFSKILAPGFRVAWLAAGPYVEEVERIMLRITPLAVQLTVASFLQDGGMRRHLHRLRQQYKENICKFRNSVSHYFPEGTKITDPQGGQFLWVELPEEFDTVQLFPLAKKLGMSFNPGIQFSASHSRYRNCLGLNCSTVKWSEEVDKVLQSFGQLLSGTVYRANAKLKVI